MSKKNQNNDDRDQSLTDEQDDISNNDQVSEDTIESVEEIEEIYEEVANEGNDEDDRSDHSDHSDRSDQEDDQGFDQQPIAATPDSGSGGNGMAGTAMGLSLLALAGSGYNLYNSNSSEPADAGGSQQQAVDYSSDIASIQEQINSLMQSQQELTAAASSEQAETESASTESVSDESVSDETESDAATEEVDSVADVSATENTDESTAEVDTDQAADDSESTEQATAQTETTQTTSDEDSTVDTETQSTVGQEQDSSETMAATDADTDVTDSAATQEEVTTETEITQVETTEAETAQTQTSDTESTDAQSVANADEQTETEGQGQSDTVSSDSESTPEQDQQINDEALASIPSGDEIKKMAMEQVSVVLDDAKKRLGLSEVAQLLSIGEQRLAIAGDVQGAQAALGIADQRLSEISDPIIEPVRESIDSNLEALQSIQVVDKNALTQELTGISASIDTLAFKPLESLSESSPDEQEQTDDSTQSAQAEQTASTETASDGDGDSLSLEGAGNWLKSMGSKVGDTLGDVGSGIAGDLKGMVTIQKTGPLADIVLAPEQQYFIRENIKLQLGSAQRAVLQDNTGVYKQSLAQAQSFLTDFFDTENDEVKSVSAKLQDLEEIELDLELPDISSASASLAEVIEQLPAVGSTETNSN